MDALAAVRSDFVDPDEFWSSPLLRSLCVTVAGNDVLLGVAGRARPGQMRTFAFFGAVHVLLLSGIEHPLAAYYPSVRGDAARPPDGDAAAALVDFVHRYENEITELLTHRLVQTNHVQRTIALRLGLVAVAGRIGAGPVHLLEIGCSAGLLLRHDRYGYRLGERPAGDPHSPVQLQCEWRGSRPAPDLDAVPAIASTTGIDLNPLDPANAADRRWLEALVWPEDRQKAHLLDTALTLARHHPVAVLAGDAIDLCPQWAAALPDGRPRVVFHCATRIHVPDVRKGAFDRAVAAAGDGAPLYRISMEGEGLVVAGPGGETIRHYDADGHLAWVGPER